MKLLQYKNELKWLLRLWLTAGATSLTVGVAALRLDQILLGILSFGFLAAIYFAITKHYWLRPYLPKEK